MSDYPFFIPQVVLFANSSLFWFKVANEHREFRNYLFFKKICRIIIYAEINSNKIRLIHQHIGYCTRCSNHIHLQSYDSSKSQPCLGNFLTSLQTIQLFLFLLHKIVYFFSFRWYNTKKESCLQVTQTGSQTPVIQMTPHYFLREGFL